MQIIIHPVLQPGPLHEQALELILPAEKILYHGILIW